MESSTEHNLAVLLAHAARTWPHLPAIAQGDGALHSYSELGRRAARLAAALANAGLRSGYRVALVSRNAPAYVEALFACWWAGLVAVPVNSKLHPQELAFVLADSGARFAFVDDVWEASLPAGAPGRFVRFGSHDYEALLASETAAQIVAVDRDAPAWLFYTSGTTGKPKDIPLRATCAQ
jgi:long-chain acyl-CoA synthetase